MLNTGVRKTTRNAGLLAACLLAGTPALAQMPPEQRRTALRPVSPQSEAMARCARYGEGFVPVVGSEGCVRIGARLRIDTHSRQLSPSGSGMNDGMRPAAHIRLQDR